MLAIGILSLLSVGFAAMSFADIEADTINQISSDDGSGDDDVLAGTEDGEQDSQDLLDLFPFQVTDDDEAEHIDPDAKDDLATQDTGTTGDDTDNQDAQIAHPPMGDAYSDPLVIAEELDRQQILDEIAAAIARQPPNLVTVSDNFGYEIDDTLVLQHSEEGADQTHTVTAPDGENSISVSYDHEATFEINYSADTTDVTASLNSDVSGPDATLHSTSTENVDEAGRNFSEETLTQSFDSATSITLEVAQDHIGTMVSEIDLSNPADSLQFDFADDVTGNLHLVVHTDDDGDEGEISSTRTAYVVQTAQEHETLSATDIMSIINDGDLPAGMNLVAKVFLGEDSIITTLPADDTAPYAVQISNFMNDDADIGANVAWATVRETDDDIADDSAQEAAQAAAEDPYGLPDLPFNLGAIPGFNESALAA